MAFSEALLGESLLATPLQWLGISAVTAYNIIFLLSFPLSAFCAYRLTWELTKRTGPSIIAGAMYGFAMMRYAQISHLQFQWTWWMPLALLGLHRSLPIAQNTRDGDPGWVTARRVSGPVLFGVAWLGQSLSNGYFFFYFSVIVGLWLAWFIRWREWRRTLLPVLAVWVVGVAVMAPMLLGYREVQERYRFTRSIDEIEMYSSDLSDFFRVSSVPRFLHVARWERADCEVSLPMVGLCALAAAIVIGARGGLRRQEPRAVAIAHGVAWGIACALVVIIAAAMWFGLRQVRVPRVMVTAAPFLVLVLACSPAAAKAWRARSPLAFYVVAVIVGIVMAMGPFPRLFRQRIWDHSPYLTLMSIVPGFTAVRVPARFTLIVVLCLAVVTGLMLARVQFLRASRERVVYGAILAALLFETWPGWFRMADLPPAGPDLATASTVLELPLTHGQGLPAMYRAMRHGRPIVNGYSGYFPLAPDLIALCISRQDLDCLDRARRVIGSLDVMIDRAQDSDGHLEQIVRTMPDATVRGRDAQFVVYRVSTPTSRLLPWPASRDLIRGSIKAMTTSVRTEDASRAIDGDWNTAWTTGRGQEPDDRVTIEMTEAMPIGGIELLSGANAHNVPVGLRVELSDDGQRWSAAWEGTTEDARFATLLLEGIEGCRVTFAPRPARFVRLTETLHDSARPWSIAELAILRVP